MTTMDEKKAAQPNGDASVTNSTLQPAQMRELRDYRLPTDRLKRKLDEKGKGRIPLVLCACGSFSPITFCMCFNSRIDHIRLTAPSTLANV